MIHLAWASAQATTGRNSFQGTLHEAMGIAQNSDGLFSCAKGGLLVLKEFNLSQIRPENFTARVTNNERFQILFQYRIRYAQDTDNRNML